jgi:hypothetical protein
MPGSTMPLKSFRSEGNIDGTQPSMALRARKAVIVATGGSTSHVEFRRMFDPRLTAEIQVGGEPYSYQDASGELAGMAVGAALWGLNHQALENGATMRAQRLGQICNSTWSGAILRGQVNGLQRQGLARFDSSESSGPALLR